MASKVKTLKANLGATCKNVTTQHMGTPFFSSKIISNNQFFSPSILQPKLEIGSPVDAYEQEADRVADEVIKMPDPAIQKFDEDEEIKMKREPGIQMKCDSCKHEEQLQRKPVIQFKTDSNQAASSELSQKIHSQKGSGHTLPKNTKQEMEAKIGADFSGVRVHTGSNAIQLNRELGAKAFTVGNNIFFNKGQYNPNSGEGKRLMAHELVHTVQQLNYLSGSNSKIQRYMGDVSREDTDDDVPRGRDQREHYTAPPGVYFPKTELLQEYDNYFGQCPDGDINDSQVYSALSSVLPGSFIYEPLSVDVIRNADNEIRNRRLADCCNLDLAAAAHYLFARLLVANGEFSYTHMKYLIAAYNVGKRLGVIPKAGDCPVSPASDQQSIWGLIGAQNGRMDKESTGD
jgi:hypothetical protein